MKKKLDTSAITNELAGSSVFFQKQEPSPNLQLTGRGSQSQKSAPVQTKPASLPQPERQEVTPEIPSPISKSGDEEVWTDVKTSILHNVNKKRWREVIEETEAHNSSLRMSLAEREQVEDVLRELKRKHKVKTSMNELARLGLLLLLHDFKKNGRQSIITEVKTS